MFIDSHAHLEAANDLDGWLKRAKENGVQKIITIGASIETSKKAIEIAKKYSNSDLKIYATCGIHPQDGKDEVNKLTLYRCIDTLKQLALESDEVVAIGECGLDYYLEEEKRIETVAKDKKFQREIFEAQIKLASELSLPLVVHCRNAWDDVLDLIGRGPSSPETKRGRSSVLRGVFHSWTGDWEAAKKAIDLGFSISFSGIATFKNAKDIAEVAKKVPLDKMLIETDSPFLAPEPVRGSINEPKNVKMIAQFLASLRNQPIDKIEKATTKNATALFGL